MFFLLWLTSSKARHLDLAWLSSHRYQIFTSLIVFIDKLHFQCISPHTKSHNLYNLVFVNINIDYQTKGVVS